MEHFALYSKELQQGLVVTLPRMTTRDYHRLCAWRDKLKARSSMVSLQHNVGVMLDLIKDVPELGELMTPSGDYNMKYVSHKVAELVAKGASLEEAQTVVLERVGARIAQLAAEHTGIAKAVFFPEVILTPDLQTVQLCMECIKETAVLLSATDKQTELLAEGLDSEFWQTVGWEEVLAYAMQFCQQVQ